MSWFDERPWLDTIADFPQYAREIPETTMTKLFDRAVSENPDGIALSYFGHRPTWSEVDQRAEALASYLRSAGFGPGDRLAIYLQNVPHFFITVFAVWKVGGVVVPLNPMYRDELDHVFSDADVTALVVSEAAWVDRVASHASHLPIVLTCGERDFATDLPDAIFAVYPTDLDTGRPDFAATVREHLGETVDAVDLTPDDTGIIGYTSGTSGRSKGARISHRGLSVNAQMLRVQRDYGAADVIFSLAPLFHITGFVCQFLTSVANAGTLALNNRFEPGTTIDLLRAERPQYMAGPATAFMALLAHPRFTADVFESFKAVNSGGAPLPEAIVTKFEGRTGKYVGQGYGLTETTAQCIVVPVELRAPVDPESGNLSCGLPLASTMVRVLDDSGQPVGPREVGEICVRGPMVVDEYVNNPEATAAEIPDGELHTGDVGFMDEQGWVYIVDRKKDMINASGYKVWPREVEDVLAEHPAVREAAVVGVPDDKRGETVKAFISTRAGGQVEPDEIIAFCKERMAAYKYPRQVEVLDELPKTVTGKILRRELRG